MSWNLEALRREVREEFRAAGRRFASAGAKDEVKVPVERAPVEKRENQRRRIVA